MAQHDFVPAWLNFSTPQSAKVLFSILVIIQIPVLFIPILSVASVLQSSCFLVYSALPGDFTYIFNKLNYLSFNRV